jgi:HD-GYP domain-containing protein (c-di-GMP phosphodiesterase class II)
MMAIDKATEENKAREARASVIETEEYKKRLDLLYKVGKKVGTVSEVSKLLDEILRMTQQTLRASASSVLLVDQDKRELYFRVTEGRAGKALREVRLSLDSGIAGWVARHGKPSITNDVTRDTRFNKEIDEATGFVTRSILAVPLVSERKVIGVLEVLNKVDGSGFNVNDLAVLMALASTAAIAISNARLHQAVLDGYKSTVKALTAAIDAKDPYTRGHSQRVMEYALLGATSLSFSPQELQAIEFGGLLHDVGKIGIDESILRKSDGLTHGEWSVMHNHPLIGASIIGEVPFLETARDVVLHHHERYDGNGYPEGLKGEDIPIGARLLAVADAFDTMTTDRSYRPARSMDGALSALAKGAGTQFCPVAVKAFVSGFKKHQEVLNQSPSEG